ncbi:MAG: YdeI/OmpD-associated family protein [Crocinitomicaceae bacterium]|jgi:uncharacterized protein YdeI (YjbR/CyaY-like superfamily)|nr:YdeI/OmpD-associated family protein [Crocinitomicaceae bacterium]
MEIKGYPTFYASSKGNWRQWLMEHHAKEERIWLIYYKKDTGKPSLTWSEAVDEALCFGWVDSTKKTIDEERYMQLFSPRKKNSTWSAVNKKKVAILEAEGLMHPAGMACIEMAKKNGMWNFLDDVENLLVPEDFKKALKRKPAYFSFYESLSDSNKKGCLHFLKMAKREETRKKRIEILMKDIEQGIIPRPYL